MMLSIWDDSTEDTSVICCLLQKRFDSKPYPLSDKNKLAQNRRLFLHASCHHKWCGLRSFGVLS